ncbi:MAG: hypothetical protein ACI4IG_08675 [Eubacterium sp.]
MSLKIWLEIGVFENNSYALTPILTATQENEVAETVRQVKIRQKFWTTKALNTAV